MASYASFIEWLKNSGLVELTGSLGFLITIGGFVITIFQTAKAQRASEAAKKAAEAARNEISKIESYIDLSAAISALEAIKTLHREGAWVRLIDRYADARKLLISIHARSLNLTADQSQMIQEAIDHFSSLEHRLEQYQSTPEKINVKLANTKLSANIDKLVRLLHSKKI